MRMWIVLISVGLIVFLAGCAKEQPEEIQFKDDVITIENYVVDNVAPYAGQEVTISFDLKNNGDKPVRWAKVNFFDTPGFEIITDCKLGYTQEGDKDVCICIDPPCEPTRIAKGSLECNKFGEIVSSPDDERNCTFGGPEVDSTTLDVIDPLDTRSIKFILKVPENINSPTPFTVSLSVTYRYGSILHGNTYFFSGERTAIIPIIDPQFKKEPSSKFSQSDPTIGPIVFDIVPSLEREKVVDGKTIKEYWGVVGREFQTKFVMKKVVSEGTLKDIPQDIKIAEKTLDCRDVAKTEGCIEIQLTNLGIGTGKCDFNNIQGEANTAEITVNDKNNTLVCSFIPTIQGGFASEITSTVTIQYNYDYEIVRKQNFVVYPAIA